MIIKNYVLHPHLMLKMGKYLECITDTVVDATENFKKNSFLFFSFGHSVSNILENLYYLFFLELQM